MTTNILERFLKVPYHKGSDIFYAKEVGLPMIPRRIFHTR